MQMGPLFKLIPQFPFAVSNVTLESTRGTMNRQLPLHKYVFAALSTTQVVPYEPNNDGERLTDSVVVKTVRLPVLVLPVLWRFL